MLAVIANSTEENEEKKVKKRLKKGRKFRNREFRPRYHENDNVVIRDIEPIDEPDLCVLIWKSVIIQAYYDLANEHDNEAKYHQAEARRWFLDRTKNNDFEEVCDLAGVCKYRAREMARLVIKEGETALTGFNFRSLRKKFSDYKLIRRK